MPLDSGRSWHHRDCLAGIMNTQITTHGDRAGGGYIPPTSACATISPSGAVPDARTCPSATACALGPFIRHPDDRGTQPHWLAEQLGKVEA